MKKIIETDVFGILTMSVLLIPQIAHTLYVFEANSHYEQPWFSYCYAVGVDLAILIFTVKGWLKTALAYLFATLAHNLVYQFMPQSVWSGVLISAMQSVTLYSFSHLFFNKKTEELELGKVPKQVLKIYNAMQAGVRFKAQPYQCPECQESFSSSKQLNGHISAHKAKGEWKPESYGAWEEDNEQRAELV